MNDNKHLLGIVVLMIIAVLLLAACRSSPGTASAGEIETQDHHDDEAHAAEADHHEEEEAHTHSPADHMAGAHGVPEEAAEVPNPIPANDESIAAGAALFASTCAVCHGEGGHGDGPGAAGLEKQPADLTASHVQELSDGALFYIISHGRPDTPMPAWENVLQEEQRWQVVNFLRTLE